MAQSLPYTHYACPCSSLHTTTPLQKRVSRIIEEESEDSTFNPHDPRSNFSLYPIEHLLYCDECHQIRCPSCSTEEVDNWYCPNCLFEFPRGVVKSDGTRCTRNCYNCPSCTAPLLTFALDHDRSQLTAQEAGTPSGPFILSCQYCNWTSLDVGIQFAKPTKITDQLNKIRKDKYSTSSPTRDRHKQESVSADERFSRLSEFYKTQLNESADAQPQAYGSPYSSPANLARIMSLYGGINYNSLKKSREKPQPMREAFASSEGFEAHSIEDGCTDEDVLKKMRTLGWASTTERAQRSSHPYNTNARFTEELWPVATQLRTRKSKRCSACKHILSKPDAKIGSTKYKIRLLALNNIPRLALRPMNTPVSNPAFLLKGDPPSEAKLQPHVPLHYTLTVRNPLFEPAKVTLATPSITPGKVQSRVTILCPSFEVGADGDALGWDDALSASTTSQTKDGGRRAALSSLTGSSDTDRQPEAGKIWEKTRNSTTVVLEIVPGALKPPPSIVPKTQDQLADEALDEDEEVLEIPVFVRAEWEADVAEGEGKGRERRELAFWTVLGVGRIGG